MLKVNNRNTKKRCKICPNLTITTPEQHHRRLSGVFVVNLEHNTHLFIAYLLLTLNT